LNWTTKKTINRSPQHNARHSRAFSLLLTSPVLQIVPQPASGNAGRLFLFHNMVDKDALRPAWHIDTRQFFCPGKLIHQRAG
jgi:hypothetical protein